MISRRRFVHGAALSAVAAHLPYRAIGLASGKPAGPKQLEAFDYVGVTLHDGMLKRQYDQARNFYLNLPNDDILKGFRTNAGLSAPGSDLGGWAEHDASTTFGQWLSGMARMYRATGDQEILAKASLLMTEWNRTFRAKNSPYYAYANKPEASHYPFDKTVCGLVDLYCYGGDKSALEPLEQLVAWGAVNLSRMRAPANTEYMSGPPPGGVEWYTLSENLYRAYQITGEEHFRTFGALWHYDSYWLRFLQSPSPDIHGLHAYSHVNTLSSAAMAYSVTGDEQYLDALRAAYDYFDGTQFYATGGYGPGEQLVSPDGSLGRSLELEGNTFETPCGSWAGFKLARYLVEFTGMSKYGDWMERLLYNGTGAALPMADRTNPFVQDIWSHHGMNGGYHVADRGKTFYYADYRLGAGRKDYFPEGWPCCSGTYIQDVADYHNLIYFKDKQSLYVNLFVPSEVAWQRIEGQVTLLQETSYPEQDTTQLSLSMSTPQQFKLRIRVPAWAQKIDVRVNGADSNVPVQADGWATVERLWKTGDQITVKIPMQLRAVPVDKQHPDRVALVYGPVVLVAQEKTAIAGGLSKIARGGSLTSEPLTFSASNQTNVFIPFYNASYGVAYVMYTHAQAAS